MTIFTKASKTKNGNKKTLWVDFTHNSKRYRKSLKLEDTKANRRLASTQILPQIQLKVINGEFFKNQVPTVAEFMPLSLNTHKARRQKSTQDDYKSIYLLHIIPYLGNMKLNDIKVSTLANWQNDILEKVSPARLATIRSLLYTMFQDALKDEEIEKNPLSLVDTVKLSEVKIKPFSLDEVALILKNGEEQFKNFYALGFFSGMRSGEMIGLRWSDIDFSKNEITIQRNIRMGYLKDSPKNGESRTIDIIDALLPYLKTQYRLTGEKNSYVFLNNKGQHYYDIKRIRDTHWKKTLKACELEYRPIYHMRHTFATTMLENNEDILWVSHMLGHKDTAMTLNKYAKYIKREGKKRAQFLSNLVAPNVTNMSPSFKRVS